MPIDLNAWQEKTTQRLYNIGDWLERRSSRDAPYLLYGALCAASLMPLVEAARTGDLLPALMTLGSVAGGVGANLIAEQLQRWKDRADEEDVVEWVIEQAPVNAELRGTLDTVLERLDAINRASAALNDQDRQRFTAMLHQELTQLGNLSRFEAMLVGNVATARDHSVVVGRDVGGSVITDGARSITTDGPYFEGPVTAGRDVKAASRITEMLGVPLQPMYEALLITLLILQWCSLAMVIQAGMRGEGMADSWKYPLAFCSPICFGIPALYGVILSRQLGNRRLLGLSVATAASALAPMVHCLGCFPLILVIFGLIIFFSERLGLRGAGSSPGKSDVQGHQIEGSEDTRVH